MTIEIKNLNKKYNNFLAVKNINFNWDCPCTLGEIICVKTNLIESKRASIVLRQIIVNEDRDNNDIFDLYNIGDYHVGLAK